MIPGFAPKARREARRGMSTVAMSRAVVIPDLESRVRFSGPWRWIWVSIRPGRRVWEVPSINVVSLRSSGESVVEMEVIRDPVIITVLG